MYIRRMSKRYSIAEARSSLPRIVDEVEAGEAVELTRRGKAVAVVVSLRELERLRGERTSFGDAYRKFLKTHAVREIAIGDELKSIRDRGTGRKVSL
jgi:prevent-host-death family protein